MLFLYASNNSALHVGIDLLIFLDLLNVYSKMKLNREVCIRNLLIPTVLCEEMKA
jgi:hypothetical protein